MTRHSYKNAQTEDLWDALEEASNKPVRRIMSTWTRQKGFPIVTVCSLNLDLFFLMIDILLIGECNK